MLWKRREASYKIALNLDSLKKRRWNERGGMLREEFHQFRKLFEWETYIGNKGIFTEDSKQVRTLEG